MQSVRADKAVVEGIATAHGSVMQNAKQSITYIAHCRCRAKGLHVRYRRHQQATEEATTCFTVNLT